MWSSRSLSASFFLILMLSAVAGQEKNQNGEFKHELPEGVELVDPKSLGLSDVDLSKFLGNVKVLGGGQVGDTKTQILSVGFEGDENINFNDFHIPGLSDGNNTALPVKDKEIADMAFKKFKEFFQDPKKARQFDEKKNLPFTPGKSLEHLKNNPQNPQNNFQGQFQNNPHFQIPMIQKPYTTPRPETRPPFQPPALHNTPHRPHQPVHHQHPPPQSPTRQYVTPFTQAQNPQQNFHSQIRPQPTNLEFGARIPVSPNHHQRPQQPPPQAGQQQQYQHHQQNQGQFQFHRQHEQQQQHRLTIQHNHNHQQHNFQQQRPPPPQQQQQQQQQQHQQQQQQHQQQQQLVNQAPPQHSSSYQNHAPPQLLPPAPPRTQPQVQHQNYIPQSPVPPPPHNNHQASASREQGRVVRNQLLQFNNNNHIPNNEPKMQPPPPPSYQSITNHISSAHSQHQSHVQQPPQATATSHVYVQHGPPKPKTFQHTPFHPGFQPPTRFAKDFTPLPPQVTTSRPHFDVTPSMPLIPLSTNENAIKDPARTLQLRQYQRDRTQASNTHLSQSVPQQAVPTTPTTTPISITTSYPETEGQQQQFSPTNYHSGSQQHHHVQHQPPSHRPNNAPNENEIYPNPQFSLQAQQQQHKLHLLHRQPQSNPQQQFHRPVQITQQPQTQTQPTVFYSQDHSSRPPRQGPPPPNYQFHAQHELGRPPRFHMHSNSDPKGLLNTIRKKRGYRRLSNLFRMFRWDRQRH